MARGRGILFVTGILAFPSGTHVPALHLVSLQGVPYTSV